MTSEFASGLINECVQKWHDEIASYGTLVNIAAPSVSVLAKNPDGSVVWQVTLAGLVRDVTENIPERIQSIIDGVAAAGGRVELDQSGASLERLRRGILSGQPLGSPAGGSIRIPPAPGGVPMQFYADYRPPVQLAANEVDKSGVGSSGLPPGRQLVQSAAQEGQHTQGQGQLLSTDNSGPRPPSLRDYT